jgi:nicotinamidase-related amidase
MAHITLPVRHYRLGTDPGVELVEANLNYQSYEWTIPTEQVALVLVDCWDLHALSSYIERTNRISVEVLAPVAEACRNAGIAVIHAPSPGVAEHYPQWVKYASEEELFEAEEAGSWPPEELRRGRGEYAPYGKPLEPSREQWLQEHLHERRIVDCLDPRPDDFVIKTGEQLHRLCRHRGIAYLIYGGFAANFCVPGRDYGTRAMAARGYNIILLRDGTTAIEAHSTIDLMALTRAAIFETEMRIGHTTLSADLIAGCTAADSRDGT